MLYAYMLNQFKGELARLREKEKLEMVKSKIILTRLEKVIQYIIYLYIIYLKKSN